MRRGCASRVEGEVSDGQHYMRLSMVACVANALVAGSVAGLAGCSLEQSYAWAMLATGLSLWAALYVWTVPR